MNTPIKITSFTQLIVWQKGHKFALDIYAITKDFPKEELFGLTSQIRRAVVSITSNIAEGFGRQSYKDKARFYILAFGSLTEVQNQLLLARDLNYLEKTKFNQLWENSIEIQKMLSVLIKNSQAKS